MKHPLILLGVALMSGVPLPAAAADETVHVVEEGETLNGIANRAGVPRDRIIEANGLEPPYVVRIGQALKIPRQGRAASRTITEGRPTPDAAGRSPETYIVKPGETLGGIANREQVPRVLIAEANSLKPPYSLRTGQKLLIPRTRHHQVGEGDTGFGLAYRYGVSWNDIAVANGIDPDAPLRVGRKLLIPTVLQKPAPAFKPAPATSAPVRSVSRFAWPLTGSIRRGYAPRGQSDFHDGLDIAAAEGSPVRAAAAGTVIFADREKNQFGNLVVIDHGSGWHSAYGSLDKVTVAKGAKVAQGERVGLVGDTSVTGRTELHFELRRNGSPIDPLVELQKVE